MLEYKQGSILEMAQYNIETLYLNHLTFIIKRTELRPSMKRGQKRIKKGCLATIFWIRKDSSLENITNNLKMNLE